MALPRLNDVPKYTMTIPSSKKKVRYRPYLVREEKVLMMFSESQDIKNGIDSIVDLVCTCLEENINPRELTTFDVDYMFTQIRSKSVGETAEFQVACSSCSDMNDYVVNLSELSIDAPKFKKKVKLTDEYSVELKYPSYVDLHYEEDGTLDPISWVSACIEAVCSKEERTTLVDEPREEIEGFVGGLTSDQYRKIIQEIQDLPSLKHEMHFVCQKCGEENNQVLEGVHNFF